MIEGPLARERGVEDRPHRVHVGPVIDALAARFPELVPRQAPRADRDALERTLATGEMHYHSRSRGLWHKGATSGLVQKVKEILKTKYW